MAESVQNDKGVICREPTVSAHLCCGDARSAIKFYEEVFSGVLECTPWEERDGRIGYSALWFGKDSRVCVSDENPELGQLSPRSLFYRNGGDINENNVKFSCKISMCVHNVDSVVEKAVQKGAILLMAPTDVPALGKRWARIADPEGHVWLLMSQERAVTLEHVEKARLHYAETGEM